MNSIDKLIENLNKEQKEAVLNTEGPNLIVAGAGSGKTKVLTTRLIHIINQKKAWPNEQIQRKRSGWRNGGGGGLD